MTIMAMNVLMSILDQEQYWSRSSNRASSSYRERRRFHIGNHFYPSYALWEKNRIAGYLLLFCTLKKNGCNTMIYNSWWQLHIYSCLTKQIIADSIALRLSRMVYIYTIISWKWLYLYFSFISYFLSLSCK